MLVYFQEGPIQVFLKSLLWFILAAIAHLILLLITAGIKFLLCNCIEPRGSKGLLSVLHMNTMIKLSRSGKPQSSAPVHFITSHETSEAPVCSKVGGQCRLCTFIRSWMHYQTEKLSSHGW